MSLYSVLELIYDPLKLWLPHPSGLILIQRMRTRKKGAESKPLEKLSSPSIQKETPGKAVHRAPHIYFRENFSNSRQRRFRSLCKLGKSLWIFDGNFRENPPIQSYSGLFQSADKFAVGNIAFPGGGSHPYYP
jgi:hypothetical protein